MNEKHLKYDMIGADIAGEKRHPQEVIKSLGITYQHATPQSICNQWWLWNCENIPSELPSYLDVFIRDPMTCIGFGLSEEMAEKIRDYKG